MIGDVGNTNAYYTMVIAVTIMMMIIMGIFVRGSGSLPWEKKRQFILLFLVVIICAGAEWLGVILQGAASWTRVPHIIVKLIELMSVPFLGVFAVDILGARPKVRRVMVAICVVQMVLECISAFTGFIFYVDQYNFYHHGPYYEIYVGSYLVNMIYLVVEASCAVKGYQYSQRYVLGIVMLFMLIGVVVQMYNSSIRVDWLCISITAVLYYIFYSEVIQQTDVLTRLLNRRSYENSIAVLDERTAIISFDADCFKEVNDRYGHQVGDQCLAIIGEEIQRIYAPYGHCYRIGGDEFCVLAEKKLENIDQWNDAFRERIARRREEYEWMPEMAIGYAFFEPGQSVVSEVIGQADANMYADKRANKERK